VTPVFALAGLVTIAAITPGPNNLIVLRTASRVGVSGTLPAIAGVVLGGLAMLGVAGAAAALALAAAPGALTAAAVAGCLYLAWLGLGLIRRAGRAAPGASEPPGLPTADASDGLPTASVGGLFVFQFLNPKAWVMVVSAIGALPAGDAGSRWLLAATFTVIPTVCLVLWAVVGAAMARVLARPQVARWVDRAMGLLLIATAMALLGAAWRP
jgi:threonine/homoserine/homoserine lactone efflux protein